MKFRNETFALILTIGGWGYFIWIFQIFVAMWCHRTRMSYACPMNADWQNMNINGKFKAMSWRHPLRHLCQIWLFCWNWKLFFIFEFRLKTPRQEHWIVQFSGNTFMPIFLHVVRSCQEHWYWSFLETRACQCFCVPCGIYWHILDDFTYDPFLDCVTLNPDFIIPTKIHRSVLGHLFFHYCLCSVVETWSLANWQQFAQLCNYIYLFRIPIYLFRLTWLVLQSATRWLVCV